MSSLDTVPVPVPSEHWNVPMADPTMPNPTRILRAGVAAIVGAAVCFWAGMSLIGFAGFGLTMAALGSGAVGIALVIAAAAEHLSNPERRRPSVPAPQKGGTLGRCGICNERRVQRTGLVVCPTCDRHLAI